MAPTDRIEDLSPDSLASFDAVIDVRSPAEFTDDHVPGAINLPVLSNEERAEVGTIYVQESPFRARRVGAALVARNIARHLDEALAAKGPDFRPLVYCWRGGMRSGAMATVLSAVGWRTGVVAGGYKRWRRAVVDHLAAEAGPLPLILIDGQTGAGKTELLGRLADRGLQVLDLEALAAHRGSVFGGLADVAQPSQKLFETRLWDGLRRFALTQPIYVEAESAAIGAIWLPRRLWLAMKAAPRVEIIAPPKARADYLARTYEDYTAAPERVLAAIDRLHAHHSNATLAEWRDLARAGEHGALAERLVVEHYDPAYTRARKRREDAPIARVVLETLDAEALDRAAEEVVAANWFQRA